MHITSEHATAFILVLSATVYTLLQASKRWFPGVCGRYAVAINAALNLAGVVSLLPADQVLTLHTLSLVVSATAMAGGFHGIGKTLVPAKDADGGAEPTSPAAALPLLLLLLVLPLAGCRHQITPTPAAPLPKNAVDQADATANEVLQAAHAFAARVTADALSGALKLSGAQRKAVGDFNVALNAADAVEISYHRCGVARSFDSTLPACDVTALTAEIAQIERAFGAIEVSLATSVPGAK